MAARQAERTLLLGFGWFADRERFPALDLRAGAWVLPWLGGLALISYFGAYGDGAQKAYGLGVGALLTLGLSIAIYLAAYAVRLPANRVRAMIRPEEASGAEEPTGVSP